MRKYLRSKAKHNMKLEGITKLFKKLPIYNASGLIIGYDSQFSRNWRKYI